jgi:hypothetical protein
LPISSRVFPMFSSSGFKFRFKFKTRFVFNFFCYRMRDGSLVSVFYTCIYSFLQHHLLKRISFLQHDLGICVENQKGTAMCIYFWIIYCIPLISMSVFMSCSFC